MYAATSVKYEDQPESNAYSFLFHAIYSLNILIFHLILLQHC